MNGRLRVAGLFAGVGGLETGLRRGGHQTEILCELWDPARAVLAAHMPDIPCERDVRELTSLPASVDMLVGGFPCQDLSQAGLTAGIGGARSGLVGEVFRLLDENRTPWVLLENVSFMLHLDKGRALRMVIDALEERGYRWAYRVVNSLAFVPQRRERVLILATTTDVDPATVLFADEVRPEQRETNIDDNAHGFYWTEGVRGLGWAQEAVPTLKNGSTIGIPSPPAILLPDGSIITPDIRDAERLQGLEEDWTAPAGNVARSSSRWSLVGNAVTVPVAEWLGRRLVNPGEHDRDRDAPLPTSGAWPKAARYDGTTRHAVRINAFPVWRERPTLTGFLRHPGKLLSARATRGFLSRTERSTLRFVPGFQDRLRRHLAVMDGDVSFADPGTEYAVAAE